MENSSLKQYQKIINFYQHFTMLIGLDIYRIDYKVGPLTIYIIVMVVCEFFTVTLAAVTSLDDLKYALQSISVIALPIQVYLSSIL